jgi:REP element-mobilizing transposase RayT
MDFLYETGIFNPQRCDDKKNNVMTDFQIKYTNCCTISFEKPIINIGGVEDHIHLIVSIPPKIAIAEFVKKIKGSSSRLLNNIKNDALQFSWQEGYGVFSLGSKQLDRAIAYVQHQKEHHAKNTAIAALEIVQN